MPEQAARKRILGWMMFDWASQPYNTLLLTFIFGPYFASILTDLYVADGLDPEAARAAAQSFWTTGVALGGLAIAITAPILGAIADSANRRMPYIVVFSIMYVVGASALWMATPDGARVYLILFMFLIGQIGMEYATTFTNAILPDLADTRQLGLVSGAGMSLGYWGGLIALIVTLFFFADEGGRTLLGLEPVLGLDPESREGTRAVGPITAIWYFVFMIPFFMWVREERKTKVSPKGAVKSGLRGLAATLKALPRSPSLTSYLLSSMFYRDALNGMYAIGGIYAFGVLDWSVRDIGVFGIVTIIAGAIFAFIGGYADRALGPKPVILVSILVLTAAAVGIASITPELVLFMPVASGSSAPDLAFYCCGVLVGAAGGTIQAASRNMLVRQANPARMTEAFAIYAMAGKATAFLAPALIGLVTYLSGSQRIGVTPIIALFVIGLILLIWVKPDGEDKAVWDSSD